MNEFNRRDFLTSAMAALGLSTAARQDGFAAFMQGAAGASAQRIDIHHHFAPPAWVAEVKGRPLLQTANTTWTPEKSIEDLDRAGSAAAVRSEERRVGKEGRARRW